MSHKSGGLFFSNETLYKIIQNPTSQDLLFEFMELNLTLSNGTHASPMEMEIHDLIPHCHIRTVQRMAGFISELQTTQMELATIETLTPMRLIFTIIFLIVGTIGFLGNLCTIAVIIRTPTLHSQTNYFLANLALSDFLLISVGVPFDLFYLWRTIGAPAFIGYCEITSTSIGWFTYSSILTIVVLSAERLVGICYPFCLKSHFHQRTVIYTIIAIWVIAFIPSLLIGLQFKPVVKDICGIRRQIREDSGTCDFVGNINYIFELMLLFTFILPIAFIIFCYARILHTLNAISESSVRESHQPLNGRTSSNNSFTRSGQLTVQARASGAFKSQKAQRTVIKILVTVAAVFFVCYLPYHMERLFVHYYKKGCDESSICHLLYPLTGLLQYVSATLNPLIYNLLSLKFRKAFFCLWGTVFKTSSAVGEANNKKVKVVTTAKVKSFIAKRKCHDPPYDSSTRLITMPPTTIPQFTKLTRLHSKVENNGNDTERMKDSNIMTTTL